MYNGPCPCGRSNSFEACCGRVLGGQAEAETAEALMRARYSAFVTHHIDFLIASHHPDTRGEVDRESLKQDSFGVTWSGLRILSTEGGLAGDEQGWVEFQARYQQGGRELVHHERSLFRRHEGAWCYHSRYQPQPSTMRRSQPKVGRNDRCCCGSGKKFKKCCGQ